MTCVLMFSPQKMAHSSYPKLECLPDSKLPIMKEQTYYSHAQTDATGKEPKEKPIGTLMFG